MPTNDYNRVYKQVWQNNNNAPYDRQKANSITANPNHGYGMVAMDSSDKVWTHYVNTKYTPTDHLQLDQNAHY